MDTELLKTFLEVYKAGHFGRAAERLFLTQSAVSARIRLLEDSLGEPLFHRQRNNLRLTSAGQRFLGYAQTIVETWQRARHEISLPDDFTTSIAIAALSDLWDLCLLDWIGQVHQHAPDVALLTSTWPAAGLTQLVINGQQDLGFQFEPLCAAELDTRFIRRVTLRLVSSIPELLPEDAFTRRYVMVDWGTAYMEKLTREYADLKPVMFMSQGRLAMQWVLAHGGTLYLPDEWALPLIAEGTLFAVEGALTIQRDISACWRLDHAQAPLIQGLLDYFTQPALSAATDGI